MEHDVAGKGRLIHSQKVLRAKVCPDCGFNENPWDAEMCGRCDADLSLIFGAVEDRGVISDTEIGG